MRLLLVTVDGRCFWASFHWRMKTGSTRASSATPRTNVVTSAVSAFLMCSKRTRAAGALTRAARDAGAALILFTMACGADGTGRQRDAADWSAARRQMVEEQLTSRDISSPRVVGSMLAVPRHLFVPESVRADAYRDTPLPIGHGQTISQPYIVAFMTQALELEPSHRVLEIGTGSGYQAAILSMLAGEVYTIEIIGALADRARETLGALGYRNVQVRTGNGYLGWPEHAPYDRIIVTAAPEEVPPALVEQLKIGGLMAIPVGSVTQELRILRRTATGTETLQRLPVRFVPMTGRTKETK